MKVGVDLPLLSRRFRYLRLLGEGVSAQVWFRLKQISAVVVLIKACRFITWLLTLQVVLAEDTHLQNSKVVVIKVLKRHFSNVGQKVTPRVQSLVVHAAWQSQPSAASLMRIK